MSGVHKNPTISFRISDYERREIEARIKMSGMMKKTFFTRCCIYSRICVVGKKETIYLLVQTLEHMQEDIHSLRLKKRIYCKKVRTLQQKKCMVLFLSKTLVWRAIRV